MRILTLLTVVLVALPVSAVENDFTMGRAGTEEYVVLAVQCTAC